LNALPHWKRTFSVAKEVTMNTLNATTRQLIRIPCRLVQLAAHVPLLLGAATLEWLRREPILCPVAF